MRKNYVLDTNVLIHDPRSIYGFAEHNVIIPIHVLEEIDQFKKEVSERGRNARMVSRFVDNLRADGAKLSEGVRLPEDGVLRVALATASFPEALGASDSMDNRILAVALEVAKRQNGSPTIFVTQDVNLRVRADALGLRTEDFKRGKIDVDDLYSGVSEREIDPEQLDAFFEAGRLPIDDVEDLYPNQFVMLRDRTQSQRTALARYDAVDGAVRALIKLRKGVWGLRPRNKEQHYALDLLLNDEIKLVTLVGKAGTGKTLLAIAAGLHASVEAKRYHKLLVSRPIFPLGRDIGYLPGDVEEKLNPWMQPIFDNIELLLGISTQEKREGRSYQEMLDLGYVEIEPLTYIRGRSIPNQFIIVDEAQNLTPHEVKTILTRVGDNTKIVLTGDHYQIDNPYVDASNNGLAYVVERFKGEPMAGHVTLLKGERSSLAELAANLL